MAEGIKLANAYVQIIPSADGISGGIEKVINKEMDPVGEKTGKGFAGKFLSAAAGAVAAGSAIVTGAATSVWAAANSVASAGDEIDKSSQKIGVSAEQYQAMAFAAEHCGFSVDSFTLAARNLQNTDFDGTVWDATEAVMALENPTERAALAAELFGDRTAQQMMAMLNADDTLSDYMDNLAGLGGIMSQDAVSASAAFEDSLADLQHAFGGLKTGMTAEFLPAMSEVMQGLTDMVSGKDGGLEKVKAGINDFLKNLRDTMPQMINVAGELVMAFVEVIIENLPQIVEMGVEIMVKLVAGIISELPFFISKVPEIIVAFVNAIVAEFPKVITVGKNIVDGVWQGILNAKAEFVANVRDFFSGIVDSVKEALDINSPSKVFANEVGRWIPAGIAEGINANAGVVDAALADLVDTDSVNISGTVNTSGIVAGDNGIVSGIVNGIASIQSANPVNVTVQLALQNGQIIAEQIFDDLLNVGKQRGVTLA